MVIHANFPDLGGILPILRLEKSHSRFPIGKAKTLYNPDFEKSIKPDSPDFQPKF